MAFFWRYIPINRHYAHKAVFEDRWCIQNKKTHLFQIVKYIPKIT